MSNILITGSSGFIGSHLVTYFQNLGDHVYTCDRIIDRPICEQVLDDIFSNHHINIVIHCAANKYVDLCEQDVEGAIADNVIATSTLLAYSKRYNVDCFIFLSSDKAVEPVNVYGYSKLASEQLVHAYAETSTHTRYIIKRMCNVWGSTGSVVEKFRYNIEHNIPLTINQECYRYYQTINDVIFSVDQLSYVGRNNMVYQDLNGEFLSVRDVACRVCEAYHKELGTDVQYQISSKQAFEKACEVFE